MDLANKIMHEKIEEYIKFINNHCPREFDIKIDALSIHLSERQYKVIQLSKLNEFEGFVIRNTRYNPYAAQYELYMKHKEFIEDFEERSNYIERQPWY